jgi:hypothetical protein
MEGSPLSPGRRLSNERPKRRDSVTHMFRRVISKFSSSEDSPPPSPTVSETASNELKELTGRPAHTPITPS